MNLLLSRKHRFCNARDIIEDKQCANKNVSSNVSYNIFNFTPRIERKKKRMAKTKTTYTGQNVMDFINSYVDNEQKKADSFQLIELMQEWSDSEPKMWGPSIIGFGNYHYKYASGHEGDAPVLGFSPRKAALTFYVYSDTEKSKLALAELGKFKMSKACIYVKKLSDINIPALKELCKESIKFISEHHECSCRIK